MCFVIPIIHFYLCNIKIESINSLAYRNINWSNWTVVNTLLLYIFDWKYLTVAGPIYFSNTESSANICIRTGSKVASISQLHLKWFFSVMQCLSIIMTVKYLIATFAVIGNCVSDKIILDGNYSLETLPPTEDQSPLLLQASMNLRNILDVVETKQQIR